ncbi:FAD:protein FMN transferase [Sporolactobacillus sp. CPB3-1]|uniref:FAD:protein FMN transferase n=1 Tax=Sporolactobacillus mangiferae TaxID=2940498 RepID=A0ABT0M9S7_9BACL|nr:FAD:protein FMN transferase [Sporolactobacillus mangiferae]MCL1631621.1 FAD:protein FMN transferase [Sporolactobacillus mangiferae]
MYRFRSMNTDIVTYYLNEKQSLQTEKWFCYAESTLSRFKADSELSQLNQTKNIPFLPSELLFEAVACADHFYHETDGLFNPYLGRDLCRIGYDRSFEKIRTSEWEPAERSDPSPEATAPASINPRMKMITMHGAALDLGGIGKGWAAQQAVHQLQKQLIAFGGIAAGGDLIVWGMPEKKWTVSISAPESWNQRLFSFELNRPAGIATSSTVRRSWKDRKGRTYHHILDPRTHQSAQSDLLQVSVLAPDLTHAEVYAKCLIVLGWEEGVRWAAENHPELGMVGLKSDGTLAIAGAFHDYVSKGLSTNEHIACISQ